MLAPAIIDRLLHRTHVITIRGDSYRLHEKCQQFSFWRRRGIPAGMKK